MKTITKTYYKCQYCGYTDSDAGSMRKHEEVCKSKIDIESLIGQWVQVQNSAYFLVMDIESISGNVRGIEIGPYVIHHATYKPFVIVNKPLSKGGHKDLWRKWVRIIGIEE